MILSFSFFTWLFFVIYDFWNKSLVSNIIYKNSRICSSLFSRAVLLTPVIEQAALKTRKLFPHQLLHINLDVNLLSLYVTYILSLYFAVFFLCVLFFVLNNVTFTNVTNHNDYHKIRWRDCWGLIKVYLLFSRKKCRAKTRQLSVSSYFLSVLASF